MRSVPLLLAVLTIAACTSSSTITNTRPAGPATPVTAPVARLSYVGPPPPPPQAEQPGPPPVAGQVWLGGYWTWTGARHEWVAGHWETPRPGQYWVPFRWQQQENQWRLFGGYWQKR